MVWLWTKNTLNEDQESGFELALGPQTGFVRKRKALGGFKLVRYCFDFVEEQAHGHKHGRSAILSDFCMQNDGD
jgi:hypothetical protein